jgi:hypothetical protein
VLGHSSGGPYALGCAFAMSERCESAVGQLCRPPSEPDPFSDDDAPYRVGGHEHHPDNAHADTASMVITGGLGAAGFAPKARTSRSPWPTP